VRASAASRRAAPRTAACWAGPRHPPPRHEAAHHREGQPESALQLCGQCQQPDAEVAARRLVGSKSRPHRLPAAGAVAPLVTELRHGRRRRLREVDHDVVLPVPPLRQAATAIRTGLERRADHLRPDRRNRPRHAGMTLRASTRLRRRRADFIASCRRRPRFQVALPLEELHPCRQSPDQSLEILHARDQPRVLLARLSATCLQATRSFLRADGSRSSPCSCPLPSTDRGRSCGPRRRKLTSDRSSIRNRLGNW
jgi:hypothetical protein